MRMWRLTLCLVLTGCASASGENPFGSGAGGGRGFGRSSGPVELLAISNAFADMHLYVVQEGGRRQSLGMLTGLTRYTFVIPRTFSRREIQILAEPIGGFDRYVTPVLLAYPGQRIRLQLQNNLVLSSAWVEDVYEEEEEEPQN